MKEKVNQGRLKISYVSTKEQCADSLTKHLRSGTDQAKAQDHLSLVEVRDCKTGRGEQVKACGMASSSLSTGEARPRVCRIFCPEPGELRSELTERKLLGPYSPARGKKSLCRKSKLDRMDESVAISGQIRRLFADLSCERFHRDLACTGARDKIMVRIRWRSADPSDEPNMEVDDAADWADDGDDHDQADDWRLQNYVDIKNRVNANTNATEISSVDTTSIVTKTDPIPMKDVRQFFIDELFPGYRYAGNNNIRT